MQTKKGTVDTCCMLVLYAVYLSDYSPGVDPESYNDSLHCTRAQSVSQPNLVPDLAGGRSRRRDLVRQENSIFLIDCFKIWLPQLYNLNVCCEACQGL